PAVDADDRPIRLLARKSSRERSAGRVTCERLEEGVRRRAERKVLDLDLRDAVGVLRSIVQDKPHETRLRIGRQQGIGTATSFGDGAHPYPALAIVGEFDVVTRR